MFKWLWLFVMGLVKGILALGFLAIVATAAVWIATNYYHISFQPFDGPVVLESIDIHKRENVYFAKKFQVTKKRQAYVTQLQGLSLDSLKPVNKEKTFSIEENMFETIIDVATLVVTAPIEPSEGKSEEHILLLSTGNCYGHISAIPEQQFSAAVFLRLLYRAEKSRTTGEADEDQ